MGFLKIFVGVLLIVLDLLLILKPLEGQIYP